MDEVQTDEPDDEGRVSAPLPASFSSTRESLRALACYVISPARKARTGRIGLRPVGGGFGTPPFDDGSSLVVHGETIAWLPGEATVLTTLAAAADVVGVELSPDPGVGNDLPPLAPDVDLAVDAGASLALGSWYAFGGQVIESLRHVFSAGTISEAQLWPEHFDLAVTVELPAGAAANMGFSPGDTFHAEPYAYVGPHSTDGLSDAYWNAPFGAYFPYAQLTDAADPVGAALSFVLDGLDRLTGLPTDTDR